MSDSNQPEKEKLPVFKTWDECLAFCNERDDNFYVDAFMLEAWIGMITERTVEQYAGNKSGNRHLQTGTGWEAWQSIFGHAKPGEWGYILQSLARFGSCDTPGAEMAGEMFALVANEDQHAEPVSLSRFAAGAPNGELSFPEMIEWMPFMFRRMADWMEAMVHWEIHRAATAAPIAFGATEQRRELANIGLIQAGYAGLGEHCKEWWKFRHEELAKQFHGTRDWLLVGKAQSFEKWGELRRPAVDELTIHWWPLLKRYRWTDHDMRGLLRRVVPHPDSYPLREDKELADYRKKALGLIKGKGVRDKSAPGGKPAGWRAALAMAGKLSE
jgi:hypothetical protein